MNNFYSSLNALTTKQLLQQLIVQLGKSISNPQRQALIEIYITLDNADRVFEQQLQNTLNGYRDIIEHNNIN